MMTRNWLPWLTAVLLLCGSIDAAAAGKPKPPASVPGNACPAGIDAAARLAAARAWQAAGGGDKAVWCIAVALFDSERWEDSARAFAGLSERPDYSAELRARLMAAAAQGWLLAGNDAKAIETLSAALTLRPTDAALWIDRARAYADRGGWVEARADLDKAVALDPDQADAWVFRASARRRLGDAGGAADDLATALTLAPGNPEAFLERGILKLAAGDEAGAAADWRTVGIIAPETEASRLAWKNLEALKTTPAR